MSRSSAPSAGTDGPPPADCPGAGAEPSPPGNPSGDLPAERLSIGRPSARRLAFFAAFAAAVALLYHVHGIEGSSSNEPNSIFQWLLYQWRDRDMQLTWLMPLVGLYAVWDRRRRLAETPSAPSIAGLLATAASLGLHCLAFRAQQPRISLFTLATTLWCSAWALWGWGIARLLLFPLGYTILSFLCFHIKHYTTSLQVFASSLSVGFLQGFGVAAANTGSVIRVAISPDKAIAFNVDEGCSGLRSLVVLTALAAPFAYFRARDNRRAWILFAMSVPLAVLTNILRISTLTLFAYLFGADLAMQVYHDPAGFLVFFIAILLLRGTETILNRDWETPWRRFRTQFRRRFFASSPAESEAPESRNPGTPESPSPGTPESRKACHPALRLAVPALLLALVGISWGILAKPRHFRGAYDCPIDVQLPAQLGPYTGIEMLFCSNDQCCRDYPANDFADREHVCPVCKSPLDTISIGERKGLPDGTPILRRIYFTGNRKESFQVAVVYSGLERNTLHRPQRCLASQGFQIIDEKTVTVPLSGLPGEPGEYPVHVLDVIRRHKNDEGRSTSDGCLYAYWYFNPERDTPSHFQRLLWIATDNLFRSYRPRWAYISLVIPLDPNHPDAAYDRLRDVVPRLLPIVRASQESLRKYDRESLRKSERRKTP